jgi:hypothetical protein
MKTYFLTLLLAVLGFLSLVTALQVPQKFFIVRFPAGTPGKVVEDAKEAIRSTGGMITHEFTLFL